MRNKRGILITGASSETGMALIRKIGMNYTHVIAHYNKSAEGIRSLNHELDGRIIPVQADFSSRDSIEDMICKIREKELIIDHIVHLAAPGFHLQKFAKEDIDEIRKEYISSAESIMIILKEFITDMSRRKYGKAVFMLSSNVTGYPAGYQLSYTVSKYALLGLMKSIAVEYAGKGITSNAVSPDMMDTKFVSGIPELIVRQNAESSPCKRNLYVEEVITAFEYLLSDGADRVTGINIPVTGGRF